jgi:hypothetical protein
MIRFVALAALVFVVSTLTSTPVGAEEETVTATVTGESISMTVSPTSIDYGTVPFEASRSSLSAVGGPITFVATNTGNVDEDFLVRGTNAAGTGFTWNLQSDSISCGSPGNNNKFRHSVTPISQPSIFLTTADDYLSTNVAPAGSQSFNSEIYMPCFGSDGAGLQATTQIIVTAVAAP